MAEKGTETAMKGRSGEQRSSSNMYLEMGRENLQISHANTMEVDREIARPVRNTAFPFEVLAATKRETAVWIDPAQRAKQMP